MEYIALDRGHKGKIISVKFSRRQASYLVLASYYDAPKGQGGMNADKFFEKLETGIGMRL